MSVAGSQPDLQQQVSGSIANSLIPNEEPDPEQQALRTTNSPASNRERFQHNQRTTAHGLVSRSGWVLFVVMILLSMLFFVWVVFYVRGWKVWRDHRRKPCDEPLADWLLVMLILPLMALSAECMQGKMLRILVILVTLLALLLGLRMFYHSETCESTNPKLYAFVRQYLIFLSIWWICWVVMPLCFFGVVVYGMMHGWFNELNAGASPETIKQVETVPFDADIFTPEDGKTEATPECCICTEGFGADREIKRTECLHYFHEDCLGKWLKVSTTCPLCRLDLEKAALGDAAPNREETQHQWQNYGANLSDAHPTSNEAEEVQQLLRTFPGLDDSTALLAVRNHGSAEQAVNFLTS